MKNSNAADTTKARKKPGPKPLTEAEKKARAKEREAIKQKAANLKPVTHVQYQDVDVTVEDLIEAAKADFRSARKRTPITDLQLYVKPEERTAYYVINESYEGQISF